MIRNFFIIILSGSLLFAGLGVKAADFSSTNFTVKDPVIESGAGYATSASYRLWSALGQPAIGISSVTSFGLRGGFLYFPAPTVATSAVVPTETPPSSGGGGGNPLASFDFNGDGEINIVDLSIFMYFYGKTGSVIQRYDLNHDDKIDLVDVSIIFYYWTEIA
ncbi:MAG: hypothetical protein UY23_C0002G0004 [Candidatus Jorgensenbacteria bacterium GW2011_GWA1_48_11]|uniref:Dockerin domain-containing protein n=1 Tax=Candidatus Jorgensenbacteria bacterium GW2011_GWA1_48_11 TaxID=1618660 RepID=A0A0G1XA93_9BACT|nr:MAG: hypothetical protein UY23_C0002G0004 [Candidatus Jorgensenbacteria bacterium GW2011_GWA1_48_11]KKW12703.1 MAG: hypothetical protein UY51_C0001G0003 [Candidatus Jorgensenbacteria bacterium GW2011_GWB1_49_9]